MEAVAIVNWIQLREVAGHGRDEHGLHCRVLHSSSVFMVLGVSALLHAIPNPKPDPRFVFAGAVLWMGGVALSLLHFMVGRFPAAAQVAAHLAEATAIALFYGYIFAGLPTVLMHEFGAYGNEV